MKLTVSTLKVDLQELQTTASALKTLRDGVETTTNVGFYDITAIAAQSLIQAVQNFESDWSNKRQSLLSSLRAVEKMLDKAVNNYKSVDTQLATALANPHK
ncbi:MAG: hypothetical protein GJU76_15915 [Gallionella sp.]|jgi:hypothetical protein|nr:hypothetical protein [Gallionella sp.]